MDEKRTGQRIVRASSEQERKSYRKALKEEKHGLRQTKNLEEKLRPNDVNSVPSCPELRMYCEQQQITLTDLADRLTVGSLSRLKNMEGPIPRIETLHRDAQAIGNRLDIAVVAER